MKIIKGIEKDACVTFTVTATDPNRYLKEIFDMKCMVDLLASRIFPNAKEFTESMSAFHAVKKVLGSQSWKDPYNFVLFDIACGSTPRNAALFACRTVWPTIAVDPQLDMNGANLFEYRGIRNVVTHKCRIEDLWFTDTKKTAVIIAVHAHVGLDVILKSIKYPHIVLVAMECCTPLTLDIKPVLSYEDYFNISPKRRIDVWELYNGVDHRDAG
jgi:hypothetical protein